MRWSSPTSLQAKHGVKTGDIGKRLIDYGFHAYTVSFPMIVSGSDDD
jgi:glycine dehydrogenase subunit 2